MGFSRISLPQISTSLIARGISSHVLILVFSLLLLTTNSSGSSEMEELGTENGHSETGDEGHHQAHAVLYLPFILTLGVVVYYCLSRYLHWLPYTAVMFLLGTIMGIISANEILMYPNRKHYMHDTLLAWQSINSEVLLLVFLPGLIFKDALGQNAYLFAIGIVQLIIFAFPMVLAGTALTACVAYYIFPFKWSFHLCLTFGSILSATDPVAVAALLEEVGAPPRLSTHIAGESLLNDGAAIVFFHIFKELFNGDDIGWGEGMKIFVQKTFGGIAIGLVAGVTLIFVLARLNRRFGREENIVQVTAVVGLVYLNYFVAEVICETSGVIATVAAGLCVKFVGRSAINDIHLMDDFISILEHILNTVLFSLGGLVWGEVLVKIHEQHYWKAKDWGYLILLYLLLHVIRFCLFVGAYPITVRIGLKTNWKETAFQIYGGLRGAVGIALAIALDIENEGSDKEEWVKQVYAMVGGIALLTLFINGSTAGPLLKKLGLADSTEAREKIIEAYRVHMRSGQINNCVKLLTNPRFKSVDFEFIQKYIPFLADLTVEQLAEAVETLKGSTPTNKYKPPYLGSVLSVLKRQAGATENIAMYEIFEDDPERFARMQKMEKRRRGRLTTCRSSMHFMMKDTPLSTKELRLLFISMLRAQYERLIEEGFLTSQHGLTIAFEQSLEMTQTEVNNDGRLNDLHHLRDFYTIALNCSKIAQKGTSWFRRNKVSSYDDFDLHQFVLLELAFATAHERAQEFFQEELGDCGTDLSEGGRIVVRESTLMVKQVENDLKSQKLKSFVREVTTHKFCDVLLSRAIQYVERLVKNGLLKETEAEEIIEEMVHLQNKVRLGKCNMKAHACERHTSLLDINRNASKSLGLSVVAELHSTPEGNESSESAVDVESP
mmetsp:Transcript_9546/g.20647  ORF Transcript_9546/g.20647 Transcript_9546/m.20647 type:complete len:892 (+) Transcript_9546:81-2756(+)